MNKISADECPGRVEVCLGLGANLSDPAANVVDAFRHLSEGVLTEAKLSSLYITEPQDVEDQPEFINAACIGYCELSPLDLLHKINAIENMLGRSRARELRRGPRPIDIDILSYGDFITVFGSEADGEGKWLRIPHEQMNKRRFALVPLLELIPGKRDPISGVKYSEIEKTLTGQGIYSFDTVSYIKSHGAKTGG